MKVDLSKTCFGEALPVGSYPCFSLVLLRIRRTLINSYEIPGEPPKQLLRRALRGPPLYQRHASSACASAFMLMHRWCQRAGSLQPTVALGRFATNVHSPTGSMTTCGAWTTSDASLQREAGGLVGSAALRAAALQQHRTLLPQFLLLDRPEKSA